MTAMGSVSRGSPPSRRAMREKAWFAIRRPNGIRIRLATTSASSGVTESAIDGDDPRLRRVHVRGGSSGIRIRRGEAPVAQDRHRRDRRDAAHGRADEGNAPDPPLAQPGERTRHIFDLVEPEAGGRVVGPAVTPEVQAQHGSGPPKERPHLEQVRRHRPAPAVQQQDGLPGVRCPALAPGSAASQRPARRTPSRDRSRTTSPPSRSRAVRHARFLRQAPWSGREPTGEACPPRGRRPNATTGAAATTRTRRITRRQRLRRAAGRSCRAPRNRRPARRGG